MRTGKLSNEQLDRLILSKLKRNRSEIICSPGIGVDCTAVDLGGDIAVLSCDPITAADSGIGRLTVNVSCNDAAASGAEPIGLMVTFLLPPSVTEDDIDSLMDELMLAADAAGVDIIGGHTEITPSVNRIVTCATVIARPTAAGLIDPKGMQIGNDIVLTKHAGLEGAPLLADKLSADSGLLCPDELAEVRSFLERTSVVKEGLYAAMHGATAMHDVTEGGVFGALWEMSAAAGIGIRFDAANIPVHHITRKLCGYFNIDPYKLISSGCMLIACTDGHALVDGLAALGIDARIIGRAEGDSVITVDGMVIDPPQADEIYKAL